MRIDGPGASVKANMEHAVRMIDGDSSYFSFVSAAPADLVTEFVYELPALTTFDRFAVPNVGETPSPFQRFARGVEVCGAPEDVETSFELLASGTLETHGKRGLETALTVHSRMAVLWVRLRLSGGIDIREEKSFIEFSEIVGNGTQEPVELVEHFNGIWKRGSLVVELSQDGATVTGCYEAGSKLAGTVSGNVLRTIGESKAGIPSAFVLRVTPDGELAGVRSSNSGPFRRVASAIAPAGTTTDCSDDPKPELGCGSVVHGINFDFDSARIRPESETVLQALFDGLV